jgi:hypothetical protein
MGGDEILAPKKYLTFTQFIIIFINRILQPKGVIFVSEPIF